MGEMDKEVILDINPSKPHKTGVPRDRIIETGPYEIRLNTEGLYNDIESYVDEQAAEGDDIVLQLDDDRIVNSFVENSNLENPDKALLLFYGETFDVVKNETEEAVLNILEERTREYLHARERDELVVGFDYDDHDRTVRVVSNWRPRYPQEEEYPTAHPTEEEVDEAVRDAMELSEAVWDEELEEESTTTAESLEEERKKERIKAGD